MRLPIVLLVAVGACTPRDGDPTPPEPDCLEPAERGVDACALDIQAEVLQFETQTAPLVPVALRYDTAWDVPQVFAVQCTPLATGSATVSTAYAASFDGVTCTSPGPHIVSLIGDDVSGAPDLLAMSLNDRRLALGCWSDGATCTLDPFRVWVLEKSTFETWKQGIRGVDWRTHGVAAVTFRDAAGNPVEGVTPRIRFITESEPHTAIPGGEVFFLSADRSRIEAGRQTTTSSGTAVFLLVAGLSQRVSGTHPTIVFEGETGVAAAADTVFFEQLDPL